MGLLLMPWDYGWDAIWEAVDPYADLNAGPMHLYTWLLPASGFFGHVIQL